MILIATGMKSEAKALARDGVIVATAGTDHERLEAELEAGVAAGATAILSMGLAGALAPRLKAGDWVVGTLSPTGMARREWSIGAGSARPKDAKPEPHPIAQKDASRGWITRIAGVLPGAVVGRIHADGTMVVTPAQKEQYHFSERALACDMESHIAAKVARRHNLPFAVARVISDEADRAIPLAAQVAMAPDGGIRLGAVLFALLKRPWQVFALIALGLSTASAMRTLTSGYRLLAEDGFAKPEVGSQS
ncbi:phosphorylase family protein [Sphingomonas oryzagri]|uniref:Phosphorylase n=1 Tax=Sphingomonas oryzagri TaxID=3042314 RepID=A0ABT6N3H2_9SPHN|nr:phosphorylase [Sphingomonas oryzagri]MDH7639787.1 phosphorylase [Sphingomonas oryzagri]